MTKITEVAKDNTNMSELDEYTKWKKDHTIVRDLPNTKFISIPNYYDEKYEGYPDEWQDRFEITDDDTTYSYIVDYWKSGYKYLNTFEIKDKNGTDTYELVFCGNDKQDKKERAESYINDLTWRLYDGIKSYIRETSSVNTTPADTKLVKFDGSFDFNSFTREPNKFTELWNKSKEILVELEKDVDRNKFDINDGQAIERVFIAQYLLDSAKNLIKLIDKEQAAAEADTLHKKLINHTF